MEEIMTSLFEGIAEAMEGINETMNVEATEDENEIIESSGSDDAAEDSAGSECIGGESGENEESKTEECGEETSSGENEPGLIESIFNFIDTMKNDEVSREVAFEEFGEMCRDSINELCDILKEFPKIFSKE